MNYDDIKIVIESYNMLLEEYIDNLEKTKELLNRLNKKLKKKLF